MSPRQATGVYGSVLGESGQNMLSALLGKNRDEKKPTAAPSGAADEAVVEVDQAYLIPVENYFQSFMAPTGRNGTN